MECIFFPSFLLECSCFTVLGGNVFSNAQYILFFLGFHFFLSPSPMYLHSWPPGTRLKENKAATVNMSVSFWTGACRGEKPCCSLLYSAPTTIICICLLLNRFYFPFSPGMGPGESRWEDRAQPWSQQKVGTPTQWPLTSPSVLHWSLCWKQWEKMPGTAEWPYHSLMPDHRQTAFMSLILSSPGKGLVIKQRLLTHLAVFFKKIKAQKSH